MHRVFRVIGLFLISFIFLLNMNANILASQQPIYLEPKKYTFVVYGDNRNNGITENKIHRRLLSLINAKEKDFIVHLGDMVLWHGAWDSFSKDIAGADIKVPFFGIRGNHDDRIRFLNKFKIEKPYYSINYGIAHLIILDDNKGSVDEGQYKWLADDLEAHRDYKWIIILAHKPLYSGAHNGVRKELIAQLEPLFIKYNVRIFIASHYHNYEHLYAFGTTHIVSGGGGAPLARLRESIPQLIKHETKYHFLLIHIDSEKVSVKVYDVNSLLIDEFTIKN